MLERSTLHKIIKPTLGQVVVCILAALGLLIIGNINLLGSRLNAGIILNDPYIRESYLATLASLNVGPLNLLVIVIFWSLVYLLAYGLFWFFSNVIIEARNEVVVETEFANKGSLIERFLPLIIQALMATVLIGLLLVSLQLGLPLWLNLAGQFLSEFTSYVAWLYAAAALIGCASNIYVMWSLGQIVFAVD